MHEIALKIIAAYRSVLQKIREARHRRPPQSPSWHQCNQYTNVKGAETENTGQAAETDLCRTNREQRMGVLVLRIHKREGVKVGGEEKKKEKEENKQTSEKYSTIISVWAAARRVAA